jgi:hypothetical protein
MPESLRQALISLLYKKEDPELLKNWRPISLLNVDYKIITKVLINSMKPMMSTVIDSDQCCAVPGRSSEDNATLLRDICDYLEIHSQTACAFISIDQEKAFDYVDWKFLDRILETMNFGPQFRSFITCIYTDIQSAILSNGHMCKNFLTFNLVFVRAALCLHFYLCSSQRCLVKPFVNARKFKVCVFPVAKK